MAGCPPESAALYIVEVTLAAGAGGGKGPKEEVQVWAFVPVFVRTSSGSTSRSDAAAQPANPFPYDTYLKLISVLRGSF